MSNHEKCHVDPVEKAVNEEALLTAKATFLGVSGMGCPTCAMRVRNGLLNLDGVLTAEVYLQNGVATVAYAPEEVTPDNLVTAVANAGNDSRHHYEAHILQTVPAAKAFTLA
jgi:copper chaperone CopZ